MNSTRVLVLLLVLGSLPVAVYGMPADYAIEVSPAFFEHTMITWDAIDSPELSVEWGWTGQGSWFIDEVEEGVSFTVERYIDDIEGTLRIGNFTVATSNTDLARELVLGVWGSTPFFPGFVIPIGTENLNQLNETAFASAERIANNYANGTMDSRYDQLEISGVTYDCIVFDYIQDSSPFYVQPQESHLAYDITTGILVSGNTSITIDNPYTLHIELSSIARVPSVNVMLVGVAVVGGVVVILIAIVVSRK